MTEQLDGQRECPNFTLLSAWCDGEREVDAATAEHLRNCSRCAAGLEAISTLDQLLKQRVGEGMRTFSAEEIKNGFYRKLAAAAPRRRNWLYLRQAVPLAAAFLLGMAAFQLLFTERGTSGEGRNPETQAMLDKAAAIVPNFPYYTTDNLPGLERMEDGSYNAMPLINLMNVATDPGKPAFSSFEETLRNDQQARMPVAIDARVRHVWVVNNQAKDFEFLRRQLNREEIPESQVSLTMDDKEIHLDGKMTKRQLVELVRACAAAGLQLVSSSQPQPEQQFFSGNENDKVDYNASFIVNSSKP
ncbi:hypothetical protein [Victivallis sp. Marseille-Q1083]|uniref:hypothetical protein n=1 Tax=Victivallis sp. Marseille-Q1083 TaxID=2717288 RepID=UPI00158C336E|nr:hypothetical protein [Victivallis sp. Marseille-Q1083]